MAVKIPKAKWIAAGVAAFLAAVGVLFPGPVADALQLVVASLVGGN